MLAQSEFDPFKLGTASLFEKPETCMAPGGGGDPIPNLPVKRCCDRAGPDLPPMGLCPNAVTSLTEDIFAYFDQGLKLPVPEPKRVCAKTFLVSEN